MRHKSIRCCGFAVLVLVVAAPLSAQRPKKNRSDYVKRIIEQRRAAIEKHEKNLRKQAERALQTPTPPTDKRLLEIHKEFVQDVEKLAKEYEREGQTEKAKVCYQEILRVVPGYPGAVKKLQAYLMKEATAEKKRFIVHANKGWQDTGIVLIKGKPISIVVSGSWTFRMTHELSADGMEIPKELHHFKLGSLIGVIDTGEDINKLKPFFVGSETKFFAQTSGRLFMRMHDSQFDDNLGKLTVDVVGTFKR